MRSPRKRRVVLSAVGVFALVVVSCGKDSPTTTNRPGVPAQLTVVSGDAQSAIVGQELPNALVVQVLDSRGKAVQGQAVNFRVTAGGGSVFAGAAVTNEDGIAKERWTLGTVAGAEQTLEARAVDNDSGAPLIFATFHATALPGPAAALSIVSQPPATVRIGVLLSPAPAARLVDSYGNFVRQSGVSVSVAVAGDGTQSLDGATAIQTDAQGVASYPNLAIKGNTGKAALRFSASNVTAATSAEMALTPGFPASMVALTATTLSEPAGGSVVTLPTVGVKDLSGNGVPNVSVQFSLSSNGGSIAPASATTDATGAVGLASWMLPTKAGTYMVVVTASELPNASITFTATAQPGAAAALTIVSGNNTTATVGTAAPPLVVRVADQNGNAVASASVAWSVLSGSGTLSASSTPSGNDGVASNTLTVGTSTSSPIVVDASVGGLSVRFSVTPTASAAGAIAKQQGDNQTASAGTPVSVPPAVTVTDAHGNPVPNARVTFAVSAGGGSVTGAEQLTDGAGVAKVGIWTLGPVGGAVNLLTATVGSLSTTFTATSTNPLTIFIIFPVVNQNTASPLAVTARVISAFNSDQISSVVASVDGRSANLAPAGSPDWTGSIALQAPTGPKTLLVTATDVHGNSVSVSRQFGYLDAPPTLIVSAPLDQAVAHPTVTVTARCEDDSPGCHVQVLSGTTILSDAQQSVNTQLSLPGLIGPTTLTIKAIDAIGQSVSQTRTVFGENSSHLTAIDSVGGNIQDISVDRLLFAIGVFSAQQSGVPVIHNRLTATEDTVTGALLTIGLNGHAFGYLTPSGAILSHLSTDATPSTLTEWRNRTPVSLGVINSASSLVVRGNFAAWTSPTGAGVPFTLIRRDLIGGSNLIVNTNSGNIGNDLDANGDVYYWTLDPYLIYRFHAGTSTQLSHQGPNTESVYPTSDGSVVVFSTGRCCTMTPPYQIVMATDTGDVVLTTNTSTTVRNFERSDYVVRNGWVAFNQVNANLAFEVWTRSPSGVVTKVMNNPNNAVGAWPVIETVGPDGQVIFRQAGRRFAFTQGGSPVDVGAAQGQSYYMNGQFYVTIGGVLFRLSF